MLIIHMTRKVGKTTIDYSMNEESGYKKKLIYIKKY